MWKEKGNLPPRMANGARGRSAETRTGRSARSRRVVMEMHGCLSGRGFVGPPARHARGNSTPAFDGVVSGLDGRTGRVDRLRHVGARASRPLTCPGRVVHGRCTRPYRTPFMRRLAPDILRQRFLIEGFYTVPVDRQTIERFFRDITEALGLRMYGEPVIFSPGGVGRRRTRASTRSCRSSTPGFPLRLGERAVPLVRRLHVQGVRREARTRDHAGVLRHDRNRVRELLDSCWPVSPDWK